MKYTNLGASGLIVSRLSFGAMTIGTKGYAPVATVGQQEAGHMIGRALDAGINFFDTSDVYTDGESERWLGQLLGSHLNDVVICTKVAGRSGAAVTQAGLSARHVHEAVDASLARLGRDWIDLYLAHHYDPLTPLEETLQAIDSLVRMGKVRYVGFSNWPAWVAAKAVELQRRNGWSTFVNAQMYYSLMGRDVEQDVVPCLQDYGIGMTAWSPLSSGFLTGRYTREDPTGGGGRLSQVDIAPFDREFGFKVLDTVRTIADSHGVTPAAVALAWILGKPSVTSAILGMSSEKQLQENLTGVDVELTSAEMAALDEVSAVPALYPHWFNKLASREYIIPPEGYVPRS